jgi:DNA-binding response OmpR family regulator
MSKGSLLLVDDDRQVLESMADWLREQGYQLDAVGSQAAAIASLSRKAYDLALIDIRLRDGDARVYGDRMNDTIESSTRLSTVSAEA